MLDMKHDELAVQQVERQRKKAPMLVEDVDTVQLWIAREQTTHSSMTAQLVNRCMHRSHPFLSRRYPCQGHRSILVQST